MIRIVDIWKRGVGFIRDNPAPLYTVFLLVAIPLAFFVSSEQFVRVARDTQDRLERSRVGIMGDVIAEFSGTHLRDPEYLNARILSLAVNNETIDTFRVIEEGSNGTYPIIASKDQEEIGLPMVTDVTDAFLIGTARGNMTQSFATETFKDGIRHWRVIRAIPRDDGGAPAFALLDVSMASGDMITKKNIRNAYMILFGVVILLLILLARHARIVDYTTLYRRLQEVDRMKDDFVSMAAHELRSPLAVIRAYTEELNAEEHISDSGKVFIERIDNSAKDLNFLIGDILDVARLQEGRMSFTLAPIEPSPIIRTIIEGFVPLATDKKLALTVDDVVLPSITVDPERFRQVMVNLIGNAVKYTPSGSVAVTQTVGKGEVEIRVSDTGIGISAEDQKRLFQKFFRVKSDETRTITGTGLGLWITAQMVEQMKGKITVESIKGKGTDFVLTFPLSDV